MGLIILLVVLLLVFGTGGYALGPGIGYFGGGSLAFIVLAILIVMIVRGAG
jgi:hypothetical protein